MSFSEKSSRRLHLSGRQHIHLWCHRRLDPYTVLTPPVLEISSAPYAWLTSVKRSVASGAELTSGCTASACRRKADLMSAAVAVASTPSSLQLASIIS